MCGIVAITSKKDVVSALLSGLKRLEYRGYDSAGIAVIDSQTKYDLRRVKGKVGALQQLIEEEPLAGNIGISHTRWATHGVPDEKNAHPHISSEVIALVHNGIIENHAQLRTRLIKEGYKFRSDTDTEVIVHLIHYYWQRSKTFVAAVKEAISELEGAYALAIANSENPDQLIGVRFGCPLVIGLGKDENYLASDQLALLSFAKQMIFLEEGDLALLTPTHVEIFDEFGKKVERPIQKVTTQYELTEKGSYRHYMAKEIFEQGDAITATIEGRITGEKVLPEILGKNALEILPKVEAIHIIACGTSYHAGLVAKYWIEELVGIPCAVEVASEYRYRSVVVPENTLFVCISQSGETADTLAALRKAKTLNYVATLGLCNVPESSLVREVDLVFITRAGMEIGVASTKAFTTQLTALLMLTIMLKQTRDAKSNSTEDSISFNSIETIKRLRQLPAVVREVLKMDEKIRNLASQFVDKQHALFLGRGCHFPIALEGALKLKEISYIHAEAYPAGELKHGPLALVDRNMPVVVIAPRNGLLEKLKSNLFEVTARGGKIFVFADPDAEIIADDHIVVIPMPKVEEILSPIVYTIPLQLLAYHVAVLKGTDVDQPRNLAKSVTVE